MTTSEEIQQALEAWAACIGSENVLHEREAVEPYERTTFATNQRVRAVLRPRTRTDVQECVRIAARHRAPLYPTSRGCNWGLGSRVPVTDGCVVIDLARLDRVIEISEAYGYAVIEPGVTFATLYAELQRRRSELMLNVIGSSPDASVVANALERGHGYGPYADRAAHLGPVEVVLADGRVIETGFGAFGDSPVRHLHPWGVGPRLEGLFSQSGLGIVTKMTTYLLPRPREMALIDMELTPGPVMDEAVAFLRRLKFDDRYDLQIRNAAKMAALGEKGATAPWSVLIGIYAETPAELAARLAYVKTGLRRAGPLRVFGRLAEAGAKIARRTLGRFAGAIRPLSSTLWGGVPDPASIASVYSRLGRRPERMNPDADGVGLLWVCPVIPFDGHHMRELEELSARHVVASGFAAAMNLRPMGPRCFDVVAGLIYLRETPADDQRALECAASYQEALRRAGYLPYRLGVHSMNELLEVQPDYADVMTRLRDALDPEGLLAPGRYHPWARS